MEATLHEVAADLGRLALLYRSQGKAQHAVPQHVHDTALLYLASYIAELTSYPVHRGSLTVQVPLHDGPLISYRCRCT